MSESRSRPLSEQIAQAAGRMLAALGLSSPPKGLPSIADAAVTDLTYRGLRFWGLTQVRLARMAKTKPSDTVQAILAIAWACLAEKVRPEHTIVNQVVSAAKFLGLEKESGFINALLRKSLLDFKSSLLDAQDPVARFNAPAWWIKEIKTQYADHADAVLHALSLRAPLTVRVHEPEKNLQPFIKAVELRGHKAHQVGGSAVVLDPPMSVQDIPGFSEGWVSVQDAAAQHAAALFDEVYLRRRENEAFEILDACAAPGGKSIALAQRFDARVWAVDSSDARLKRLTNDLKRVAPTLKGSISAVCADVLTQKAWPAPIQRRKFDAILLDAPCSASGVVRRHPEIAWKRSPQEIAHAAQTQHRMLDSLWTALKPGGELVFVTCSVFAQEGEKQQEDFLARTPDAAARPAPGRLLPQACNESGLNQDGFFYARFSKQIVCVAD